MRGEGCSLPRRQPWIQQYYAARGGGRDQLGSASSLHSDGSGSSSALRSAACCAATCAAARASSAARHSRHLADGWPVWRKTFRSPCRRSSSQWISSGVGSPKRRGGSVAFAHCVSLSHSAIIWSTSSSVNSRPFRPRLISRGSLSAQPCSPLSLSDSYWRLGCSGSLSLLDLLLESRDLDFDSDKESSSELDIPPRKYSRSNIPTHLVPRQQWRAALISAALHEHIKKLCCMAKLCNVDSRIENKHTIASENLIFLTIDAVQPSPASSSLFAAR